MAVDKASFLCGSTRILFKLSILPHIPLFCQNSRVEFSKLKKETLKDLIQWRWEIYPYEGKKTSTPLGTILRIMMITWPRAAKYLGSDRDLKEEFSCVPSGPAPNTPHQTWLAVTICWFSSCTGNGRPVNSDHKHMNRRLFTRHLSPQLWLVMVTRCH